MSMNDYCVTGRNASREMVRSGKVKVLYTLQRFSSDPVVVLANQNNVKVIFADEKRLSALAKSTNHQGFVSLVEAFQTISLKELIGKAKAKRNPLILMLDGIEDPNNLGAILRSADAFGIDGIIIKRRGEVPLNETVARVSTGAIAYVDVCQVSNLSQAISELKDHGFWIVSSDGEATKGYDEIDYDCPIVMVVGSEGFGISKNVLSHSDFIVKIPMVGHVNSLNASVATGILLSYICVSRKSK